MNSGLNKFRSVLIETGKVFPFLLCFVTLISYSEGLYALITDSYVEYADSLYLYKPISWAISKYVDYNLNLMYLLTVLVFAIRTCLYNKLSVLYLYINLFERSYFPTIEMPDAAVYAITLTNISACAFLSYKGLGKLIKKS